MSARRPQQLRHRGVAVGDGGPQGGLAREVGIDGRWVGDAGVEGSDEWQQQLGDGEVATEYGVRGAPVEGEDGCVRHTEGGADDLRISG